MSNELSIYKKLLEVKKRVPYIKKDEKNYQYTYASPSQVFGKINPILNDLGLLLITNVIGCQSQRIEIETKNGIKKEWLYDLDFIFTWVDTETGYNIDIPFKASGCNGEEKGLGSALTYAERYFILKQFNIPTDDDDPDKFASRNESPAEKEKKQRDAAAAKAAELSAAISEVYAAESVVKLTELKQSLPDYIVRDASFIAAGKQRYEVLIAEKP